ncbi:dynein light chain, cytoplasmic-like [Salvia splendens]|uniref:dynein light chain, cytoplasmic-like n=1 Tax=Salvia splendens TaxID=180675 RepID=UPI001C273D91|nr:dynein light chain, cytoplasmic-like [Salvia splendens]
MQSFDEKMKGFQGGVEVVRARNSLSSIPPTVNGGGRRKSFCTSQAELADFLSCNGVKVVAVDMPPFMQIHAVNCARKAHDSLEMFTSKPLALTLKKEFDGLYGPAWHCIVGTSFGSFVTHSVGGFMYFSMDQNLYILLFKTAVHRGK